ncbi:hypothetical protein GGF37_003310 [Kickxella alabastrina]|nr:hypothetical protein GGF37_003310 [Kickxella alabastrina]
MGNRLSFSVTETELARQKSVEDMNLTLDPRGRADAIMLVVIATVYAMDAAAVIFMLWNRKYPPLKAKNPLHMTLIVVVSIIWFVGDLQGSGHLPLANTPLANCKVFGFWMRVLMGVCLQNSLIALRSYGLYRVFGRFLPYHSLGLYLPYALYCLILLTFGIVAQVLDPSISTYYIADLDLCVFHRGLLAAMFVLLWVTIVIGGIVHWHIRGIKSSFDESREMMIAYVIVIAAVTLSTALTYSTPLYHLNVRLRIIYTSLNHIAGNSLWWVIMAKPLYKCLFDRERYLKQWIGKLRDDGLQKEYNVDSNEATAVVHGFSSSYIKRSTLLASTSGNKKGGDFHPMEDSIYSDGYDSRDRTNTIYFQHSESPLTFDGGISNDLGNCFPSAAGQYNGDVMLEVATQSLDSEAARRNNLLTQACLTSPRLPLKLPTLVSFPEDSITVRRNPGAIQSENLDNYDTEKRQLI